MEYYHNYFSSNQLTIKIFSPESDFFIWLARDLTIGFSKGVAYFSGECFDLCHRVILANVYEYICSMYMVLHFAFTYNQSS